MSNNVLKTRAGLTNLLTIIFLLSISCRLFIGGTGFKLVFYFAAVLFVLFDIALLRQLSRNLIALMIIIITLGVINQIFVGNASFVFMLISISSISLADLILRRLIYSKVFLVVFIIDIFIIFFKFLMNGYSKAVFVDFSNNYISILLVTMLIPYYLIKEIEKETITIYPALLLFMFCVLSGSRGGVVAGGIMFFGICIYKFFLCLKNKIINIELIICLSIIILFLIIINIISNNLNVGFRAIDSFSTIGLNGRGRAEIWKEYLTLGFGNIRNFFLGVPISELNEAARFEGNLHNSFLHIHANYGLIGICGTVIIVFKSIINSLREKRWLLFVMILVICSRGLVDRVFGGYIFSLAFACILVYEMVYLDKHSTKYLKKGWKKDAK